MRTQRIGTVLSRVIKDLKIEERMEGERLLGQWNRIIGERIAGHSRPIGIKRKKLFVHVDSSGWVYELNTHYKGEILNKINEYFGKELLEDIYFKIGEVEGSAEYECRTKR